MSRTRTVPKVECPEPGIYEDVPPEVYHSWPAFSNTLSKHLDRSPAHAKAYLDGDHTSESRALRDGRLIHTVVYEPKRFKKDYVVASPCQATKGDGKRCGNPAYLYHEETGWVCGVHGKDKDALVDLGKEMVPLDTWNMAAQIEANVKARKSAAAFIGSRREVSVVWDDPETGVRCKARWDAHAGPDLIPGGAIGDLKSTDDASRAAFERTIYNFGYHRQGWLYTKSAEVLKVEAAHYIITVVEKSAPWAVASYRLTSLCLDAGGDIMRPLLRLYAECKEKDEWPGYPDRVEEITLPDWAWRKNDEIAQDLEARA